MVLLLEPFFDGGCIIIEFREEADVQFAIDNVHLAIVDWAGKERGHTPLLSLLRKRVGSRIHLNLPKDTDLKYFRRFRSMPYTTAVSVPSKKVKGFRVGRRVVSKKFEVIMI